MSVTDNKKTHVQLFANRNAERLCGHGNDGFCWACAEEGEIKRQRRMGLYYDARLDAGTCTKCGKQIAAGEPVAMTATGIWRRGSAAACLGCVSEKHLKGSRYWPRAVPKPCAGCDRDVYFAAEGKLGAYCCDRCSRIAFNRYHAAKRKAQRRRRLEKTCAVCGKEFAAKRSDAKTCSAACKQKAYRRRQLKEAV